MVRARHLPAADRPPQSNTVWLMTCACVHRRSRMSASHWEYSETVGCATEMQMTRRVHDRTTDAGRSRRAPNNEVDETSTMKQERGKIITPFSQPTKMIGRRERRWAVGLFASDAAANVCSHFFQNEVVAMKTKMQCAMPPSVRTGTIFEV